MDAERNIKSEKLQEEYERVIKKTQDLLNENSEWTERYRSYCEAITNKSFKKITRRIRVTDPLFSYTTISNEKKVNKEIIRQIVK